MKLIRLALAIAGCSIVAGYPIANANPGLPTRNLNPVLQPIFLPSYFHSGNADGWHIEHSLYIGNSYDEQTIANERLVIDAENYRYELGLAFRRGNWELQGRVPYSANRGGRLDSVIEGWHSTFGFPDGGRPNSPRNVVNIEYERDGIVEFSQTESSSGIGDMSIAIGYQPSERLRYFLGIELPTGSSSNLTGNESIDVAFWVMGNTQISPKLNLYGLAGISLPADDGMLAGLLADKIWVGQAGLGYRLTSNVSAFAQLDVHSDSFADSRLKAFGYSWQMQFGLGFDDWLDNHRVELFFSEDIDVGTAPDISFGLRIVRDF